MRSIQFNTLLILMWMLIGAPKDKYSVMVFSTVLGIQMAYNIYANIKEVFGKREKDESEAGE